MFISYPPVNSAALQTPVHDDVKLCTAKHNTNVRSTTTNKGFNEFNTTMVSLNKQSVLLQTVVIEVTDDRNNVKKKITVLFDSGSMKTYISQQLVQSLNLQPISKQELYVNSFGSNTGKHMESYGYNVSLKGLDGSHFYVKCNAVPVICAPICAEEAIESVKSQFPFLGNLVVGSNYTNIESTRHEIDMLIGSDYYWSFVNEDSTTRTLRKISVYENEVRTYSKWSGRKCNIDKSSWIRE